MNIVISGTKHTGKTTAAGRLVEKLRGDGERVGGFLCLDGRIVDLASGRSERFLYREEQPDAQRTGPYWIPNDAIRFGEEAARRAAGQGAYVFIDEYGKLELQERGFHPLIEELWGTGRCVVLVRDVNAQAFQERFGKCALYRLTIENREGLPDVIHKDFLREKEKV